MLSDGCWNVKSLLDERKTAIYIYLVSRVLCKTRPMSAELAFYKLILTRVSKSTTYRGFIMK